MTIALQDGPDFYLFDGDDEEPVDVIHSPFEFNDGDLTQATEAREWFRQHHPDATLGDA